MINRIKRTFTSVLKVSPNRRGNCLRCGACCKLPYRCPFLRYDHQGKSLCLIYHLRPLNCRKYPRTASESLTKDTCGFRFDNDKPSQEKAR